MGCRIRVKKNGKGCENFNDGLCATLQFYRCQDWIASSKIEDWDISYSQMRSFERCPYKWSLEQITGIRVKQHYLSIQLRMGIEFARIMGDKTDVPATYFSEDEQVEQMTVHLMKRIIAEYDMLDPTRKTEVELRNKGFHGIVDFIDEERKLFGELKFTGSPQFYLNSMIVREQLEGYFLLNPDLKSGFMLPVRNPALRDKVDEDSSRKVKRIEGDIRKRINYYFPEYNKDRNYPKWGRKFSSLEFLPIDFIGKINWTKGEIKRACKANYFIQRIANCLNPWQCEFFSVCESGGINWEVYETRTKGGDINENEKAD